MNSWSEHLMATVSKQYSLRNSKECSVGHQCMQGKFITRTATSHTLVIKSKRKRIFKGLPFQFGMLYMLLRNVIKDPDLLSGIAENKVNIT